MTPQEPDQDRINELLHKLDERPDDMRPQELVELAKLKGIPDTNPQVRELKLELAESSLSSLGNLARNFVTDDDSQRALRSLRCDEKLIEKLADKFDSQVLCEIYEYTCLMVEELIDKRDLIRFRASKRER